MFTDTQKAIVKDTLADRIDTHGSAWIAFTDEYIVEVEQIPDYDTSLRDFDYYGNVEFVCRHGIYRPEGFDGGAKKITSHFGEQVWWQPPKDVNDPELLSTYEKLIREIIDYGWSGYRMSVYTTCDCCNQRVLEGSVVSYGWEPFSDGADIMDILMENLEYQVAYA